MSQAQDGERRHLTVLFCDLLNSTEIAAQLDPEEWRDIVAGYQRASAEAVTQLHGHVAQYLGDGLVVYFGWPEAHEDDAARAVRAGLAVVDAVAALTVNLDVRLSVRVGIDTGLVVVGPGGGTEVGVFGDTPNIAARVQAMAVPDSVFITAAVHRLVSGLFVVEDRGVQQLKGIKHPVQLYRVIRPTAARRRTHSAVATGTQAPFVGREDEMRLLLNRWGRAREGEGQLVIVVGEPGVGKSRLVEEFRARIRDTPHSWVECAGEQSSANTPFHSVIQILGQGFGWRGEESKEDLVVQLERSLELSGLKLGEAVPLIAEMLSLPVPVRYPPLMFAPDQKRKRLLANLVGWTLNAARLQPVVMVLEDLQWADPSTLELMETLVEQAVTVPLLLLYTTRPEFSVPWPMRSHHFQVTLNRLSEQHTREMILGVAARTALAKDVIEAVVKRTDGVPLFAEELTRLMLEGNGRKVREIPVTLQDSLMARLDRLGPAKEVAQVGAVLGREFSYELLHAVSSVSEAKLQAALVKLTDAELIYTRGIAPEAQYQFKHALIQDAAYEALLKRRRKELHRRAAETLAQRFPEVTETQPEVLARHLTQAGDAKSALAAWQKAADTAIARHALKEAEENYRQAIEVLKQLPDSPERDELELKLFNLLVQVLHNTKGHAAAETVEASTRARELARRSGTFSRLYQQNFQAFQIAGGSGDFPKAALIAEETLELARLNENALPDQKMEESDPASRALRLGHRLPLATAHGMMLAACYMRGDLPGSEAHFQRLSELFASSGHELVKVFPMLVGYASWTAWRMGRMELARERNRQALVAAAGHGDAEHQIVPQVMAAVSDPIVSVSDREALARDVMAVCERFGIPAYVAEAQVALGRARLELGARPEGLELIQTGIGGTDRSGTHLADTYHYTVLAEALLLNERTEEALAAAEKAVIVNPSEVVNRSEAYRIRGVVKSKIGMSESAEADFRQAIALAQGMSAKLLELRAATNLARLLLDTGRRDEARVMLADIYNWFTEGFETADLKDAKALLEELSN